MSGPDPSHEPGSELRRRRDELAEQVAELQWNLGGLTYEMAIRDHFRIDVLVRRAAMLQERDAELAELERLLRMEESAVAGSCANCGAVHSRGAVFCWQCGAQMMERSTDLGNDDSRTVEMEAATVETGAAESDADTVEVNTRIGDGDGDGDGDGEREGEGEGDRMSAQPLQAPALTAQEAASQESIPLVAPQGDENTLGRPVQTGL
jgi:hypothetical protein